MGEPAAKKAKAGLPATFVEGFHDAETVRKMIYRPLGGDTGVDVSILSLGCSSLGSVFRKTDEAESLEVVRTAIKSGINLLDTAPWYGHGKSEEVLGRALVGVPREAYYLNTKVGRYQPDHLEMFDFTAERVTASIDESLKRLGVEYIDSIQVHDPEFAPSLDIICNETLPALAKARDAGKVKWIGVTGYPLSAQRYIIENCPVKIDTALSYCHFSMNDSTLLDFLPYLAEKKIGLINASPISMGLLTNRGPPKWHPAHDYIKDACKAAAEYSQAKGVDISKLAMRYTLSEESIPTTLVSTASIARLKSNVAYVTMTLTEEEQKVSDELMAKFFLPLKGKEDWQGKEVNDYWAAVGKKLMTERLYSK